MDEDVRRQTLDEIACFLRRERRAILRSVSTFPDAEDAFMDAVESALAKLDKTETLDAFLRQAAPMLSRAWWATRTKWVALNGWRDRPPVWPLEPDELDVAAAPDSVAEERAASARSEAVWTALSTLFARGTRSTTPTSARLSPHLTEAQWRTLAAVGEQLQDAEARTWGVQSRVATELGITRQTVQEHLLAVRAMLALTRYVAGVLSPPGTLVDADATEGSLATYERWLPQARVADLFQAVARTVSTDDSSGTRGRLQRLPQLAPEGAADRADTVHRLEAEFSAALPFDYPNCVAICDDHNPDPTRATEF